MRKVAITTDQLARRYRYIYESINTESKPFDLGKVVSWYSGQPAAVRSAMEKAEPFKWLQHLDPRPPRQSARSPWHLTALIMEEYIRSERYANGRPISETHDFIQSNPSLSLHPDASNPEISNATSLLPSNSSSRALLGPNLSRSKSPEGRVSFEPFIESNRPSVDVDSRKSADSTYSSVFSGYSHPAHQGVGPSPSSSGVHVRDYAVKNNKYQESDENSSLRPSLRSEEHADRSPASRPTPQAVPSPSTSETASKKNDSPELSIKVEPHPFALKFASIRIVEGSEPPLHPVDRRLKRISLPSAERLSTILEQSRQHDMEEEQAETQYELKAK